MTFEVTSIQFFFQSVIIPIITGCATVLVAKLWDKNKEDKQRKSDLLYTSVRIAVELEKFSVWYAKRLQELDEYAASHGSRGKGYCRGDVALRFPDDVNWKVLDPSLMNEILSLENRIHRYRYEFGEALEFEDDIFVELFEARKIAITIGVKALALAKKIRENAGADLSENEKIYQYHWKQEELDMTLADDNKYDIAL